MINFNDQSALSIHSYWYTYTNYNITAVRDFILVAIRQNGWNDIIERKIYGEIIICARLLVKKKKKNDKRSFARRRNKKKKVNRGKNNDVPGRIQWNRSNLLTPSSLWRRWTDLSFFFSPSLLLHFANYYLKSRCTPPFFRQNDEGNLNVKERR